MGNRKMQDLDRAKSLLKTNSDSLVIVKNDKILFETNSSGIRGLLVAIERLGGGLKGSVVADTIVGEAAAQLCAHSRVDRVFAVTLSKCGKDVLDKNEISYEYENMVPHILNFNKTDLCPFEKLVAGSSSPAEAYERLKQSV